MGAWGTDAFENDTALDFVTIMEEAPDGEGTRAAPGKDALIVMTLMRAADEEDGQDSEVAAEGLAAAEILAAESEQPKYKRLAIAFSLALPLWLGGWVAAILSHAIKPEPAVAACVVGGLLLLTGVLVNLLLLSQAKLNDLLRQQGFVSQTTKTTFWKGQVANLPDDVNLMFRAAAGIGSIGRAFRADVRTDDRGETWFIRHIVQHGKSSTTRNIMLVRSPNHWPRVFIHRRSIFDTVKKLFGTTTIPLEDPKFNEAVAVSSSNADFAILLMGPALQELALSLKIGDELVIGGGAICFVTLSTMTQKNWTRVMDLFERAQAAIPPELAEWQPIQSI